jgi:hypothetical protein
MGCSFFSQIIVGCGVPLVGHGKIIDLPRSISIIVSRSASSRKGATEIKHKP